MRLLPSNEKINIVSQHLVSLEIVFDLQLGSASI